MQGLSEAEQAEFIKLAKTKMVASFPMHMRRLRLMDPIGNPLGATKWANREVLIARASELQGKVHGVCLNRMMGSVPRRLVGHQEGGDPVWTDLGGPDDKPLTSLDIDMITKLRDALHFTVWPYIGYFTTSRGYDDLKKLAVQSTPIIDVAASNTNGHLVTRLGCVVEPTPKPGKQPEWWTDIQPRHWALVERADLLLRQGYAGLIDMVAWNGGSEDGDDKNAYVASEVLDYMRRGHLCFVPQAEINW